jgi:DNA-binding SARP family transcriptional activator
MSSRIKLLGPFHIVTETENPSELMKWSKGCALLAFLIVSSRPQNREALGDLLWNAATTAQSLQNLRKLLSRVRQWVPELVVTRKWVRYRVETDGSIDLLSLLTTLNTGSTSEIDDALRLCQGDLLDGFYLLDAPRFNEWLMLERERLRQRIIAAYRQVCITYAEQKAWSKGIDAARRWQSLNPYDEEALRHWMQMLAADGHVETALQQYVISRQQLQDELGVDPEQATLTLAHQLTQLREKRGGHLYWNAIESAPIKWPDPENPAEPGPLPTLSTMPYQRNIDFTGRRESLLRLAKLLLPWPNTVESAARVVAITGMGGLGKTQLAVEFCYRYGRYFPGGVFWFSFIDPANIIVEVAASGGERGMGLYRDADQLTLVDQLGRVQRAWQEAIPRLLVFDNCEEERLLADWMPVTGGCRILLTSRRNDWSRELQATEWPLRILDPPESAAFLQRLAPRLEADDAARIAAELGHLPLALHLAGGFLKHYAQVSADRYLSQLREMGLMRHPSLRGRGVLYSPTGHELDVSRTFAINLEQLDPVDEIDRIALELLPRAACFSPNKPIPRRLLLATIDFDEGDIEAVLQAEDGLARLISLGFLRWEEQESVIMHRLVAAFANEFLGENEEAIAAVTNVLVKVLASSLHQTGHLGQLPFESSHLRYITNKALSSMNPKAFRLGTLLGRHLRDIADYENARTILEQILGLSPLANNTEEMAEAWIELARVQRSLGKDLDSLNSAEQAESLLRTADSPSPKLMVHALHRKGWSLYMLGRAEAALTAAEEALSLSKEANYSRGMISNLNLMGEVHSHLLEHFDTAVKYIEGALAIARKLENVRAQAAALSNLGEIAECQGDYDKALQQFQTAIALSKENGNKDKEIVYRANLGRVQVLLGECENAEACLKGLIAILPQGSYLLSEAYLSLAEAYLGLEQFGLAVAAGQQALAYAKSNNKQSEIGWAWVIFGRIAARLDNPLRVNKNEEMDYDARACFQKGMAIFRQLNLKRERALALWHQAQYELGQGNLDKGKQLRQEAQDLISSLNLPLLAARMGGETIQGAGQSGPGG